MKKKKNHRTSGTSKINFLNVNNDERSSRFVVDLKENINKKEINSNVYENKEVVLSWFDRTFDRIVEIEFRKNFIIFLNKIKNILVSFQKYSKVRKDKNVETSAQNNREISTITNAQKESKGEKHSFIFKLREFLSYDKLAIPKGLELSSLKNGNSIVKKLENLAFFSLFFALFTIIYKILRLFYRLSYRTGWAVLFIVKFIYFSFAKLGSGIFYLLNKFRIQVVKIIKILNFKLDKFKVYVKTNFNNLIFFIKKRISLFSGFYKRKLDKLRLFIKLNLNNLIFFIKKRFSLLVGFYKKDDLDDEAFYTSKEKLEEKVETKKTIWKILKPALSFAVMLLVLVLPFKAFTYYKSLDLNVLKGKVLGVTETAVNDFIDGASGAGTMDFKKANDSFSLAGDNFIKAQEQLENINGILFALASIVPREDIKMASISRDILEAGESASRLGVLMSNAFSSALDAENKNLIEIIDNFTNNTELACTEAKKLNTIFNGINLDVIPEEYRDKFINLKDKTLDLEKGLNSFNEIVDSLKEFLGANKDKRYLVVFQNNTELRASGGFIGSYALIDFRDGKIRNMEVPTGGGYDTEAGLSELVAAPEPLQLVNPLWHFWDANWWPDWEKSAKKLMWFYERSDGPTVDGVISLTPTVVEKLLAVIGPIDMSDDYGVIIDSENFWLTTQAISEEKLTKEQELAGTKHEPKKIIGDLLNKIFEELPARLEKQVLINFLQAAESSLSEKHILFYFNDSDLQKKVEDYGWAGKMEEAKLDYLSVINTNIAGGKSDRKMKEDIELEVDIKPDGTVINTLKIKRTHTGIKREPFSGVRNVDWMRIYVPEGSEFLEASGFRVPDEIYFEDPDIAWKKDPDVYREELNSKIHEESRTKIYKEDNKTVFANWVMVDPGEEVAIYVKYKLPFKVKEKVKEDTFSSSFKDFFNPIKKSLLPYSLQVQKQPGAMPSSLNITLERPYNLNKAWQYPIDTSQEIDSFSVNESLDGDKYYVVLFESI